MSTETLAPPRTAAVYAILQAHPEPKAPARITLEPEEPPAAALVAAAASHNRTLDEATRYRGNVAQVYSRSFAKRAVGIAVIVGVPVAVAVGADAALGLTVKSLAHAALGAIGGLLAGGAAWVGWIGLAAPKRALKQEHVASLEQAFENAGAAEKAVIVAVARTWLARLDGHQVIGASVREHLQVLAEAELPEGARVAGDRIANAFDAVLAVARDARVSEYQSHIENKYINAIVAAAKALTDAERAVAGPILFDYLFKADGAPRFSFDGFEVVSRLQRALRVGAAPKALQTPAVTSG